MVNCSTQHRHINVVEQGLHQVQWPKDMTFNQFVDTIFPRTDEGNLHLGEQPLADLKSNLSAKKLQKYAGIKFIPTDDLSRHLHLDHETNIVEIFHHTAFLKEYLKLTLADTEASSPIPRQLALEVIDSIQKVLFPLHEPQSLSLLRSLTTSSYSTHMYYASKPLRLDIPRKKIYNIITSALAYSTSTRSCITQSLRGGWRNGLSKEVPHGIS